MTQDLPSNDPQLVEEYLAFFATLYDLEKYADEEDARRALRQWVEEHDFIFYPLGIPDYEEEEEPADEDDEEPENSPPTPWKHYGEHVALLRDYRSLESGRRYRESMIGSHAYPAQRMIRAGYREHPRDWQARWRAAYNELPPAEQAKALPTEMVALLECDIWQRLSIFGLPYPPFDYASGMDVEAVDYSEASTLGLVPPLD